MFVAFIIICDYNSESCSFQIFMSRFKLFYTFDLQHNSVDFDKLQIFT